jgi:insecticidal toxin complex protein TccC
MTATIFTGTPVLSVFDNRGLTVRTLDWNRTVAGEEATLQVSHSLLSDNTLTAASRDPRRFAAWIDDSASVANVTVYASLADQPLRRDSTDSGQDITVFDAEGRPAWARDPAGTVMTWAYDELSRPVSTLIQTAGATETVAASAFIYGDNDPQTPTPQNNNLRGICVRRYDEGGLLTVDSIALSGALLSSSQLFLLSA